MRLIKLVLFLSALALLMAATSCNPVKRLTRIAANNPAAAATVCGNLYPPKEFTVTNTEYRPGTTVYRHDTVTVDCDPAVNDFTAGEKMIVRVPCPPCPVRVDTIIKTTTKQVENTAKITSLSKEVDKHQLTAERLKNGRNTWRIMALILLTYSLARIALHTWLKISIP